MTSHVIVAPHADDEVIGCWEILAGVRGRLTGEQVTIIHTVTPQTKAEYAAFSIWFPWVVVVNTSGMGLDDLAKAALWLRGSAHEGETWYFPDPFYEDHPMHRFWGALGANLQRTNEANKVQVAFYTTNMRAPYLRELLTPDAKRRVLDECYPEKRSLWAHDYRYFLFEGRYQLL